MPKVAAGVKLPASNLLHLLYCTSSAAPPLLHLLCCTSSAAPPLLHLLCCTSSSSPPPPAPPLPLRDPESASSPLAYIGVVSVLSLHSTRIEPVPAAGGRS
uniref:Uncharacterized protein n=1 Tax=Knipowitschia caucasica TaxID=637954 RepID=A0AAV2IUL2_KNICA